MYYYYYYKAILLVILFVDFLNYYCTLAMILINYC